MYGDKDEALSCLLKGLDRHILEDTLQSRLRVHDGLRKVDQLVSTLRLIVGSSTSLFMLVMIVLMVMLGCIMMMIVMGMMMMIVWLVMMVLVVMAPARITR
jgi:hypothetical protein